MPCSTTVALVIWPTVLIPNSMTASEPLPVTVTVGATRYPRPASLITTRIILPSSTIGVILALVAFETPINSKSVRVSTVVS